MSKTLKNLESLGHIAHVDDERAEGNSIIVTLAEPFCFTADPGCGVRGFDTVAEAKKGCTLSNVYRADQ